MDSNANYASHRQLSFSSVITMLIFSPILEMERAIFFQGISMEFYFQVTQSDESYKDTELSVPTFMY